MKLKNEVMKPGLYKAEGGEVLVHEHGKPAYYEKTNETFFIRIVGEPVKIDKEAMQRACEEIRALNERDDNEQRKEAELDERARRLTSEVMTWAHCLGNIEAFQRSEDKIRADIKKILKEWRDGEVEG